MRYDFDRLVERRGSNSLKWDFGEAFTGYRDLLPLWVADMDFAAPPPVQKAIRRRAAHGIYGYSDRSAAYGQAVQGWMKRRFGWEIETEWLVWTPGIVTALNLAVQAFTRPLDKVVIQPPVYHPFSLAVTHNGRQLALNPLHLEDGRYRMDPEGLEKLVDEGTRLLIFCSPHNPVGRVWSRQELLRLADICLRHGLIIVSDEIHADLVLPGCQHTPLASLSPDIAALTVTCTSPSKTFNLAGLQTSNLIIPGRELRQRFRQALAAAGLMLPNPFGIVALEAAYNQGEEWLEQLLGYLQGNFDFLRAFVSREIPKLKVFPLEGTYLAWLDFRGFGLDAGRIKELLLKEAGLWLDDGASFGEGGSGFQRLNIACPRARLAEALERLARVFGKL